MKFKAVTNSEAPTALIEALNDLRETVEAKVLHECFGIELRSLSPAEFYVQETDYAKGHEPFINYNISGVTLLPTRNFDKALDVMSGIVTELVHKHWSMRRVDIFVVIHASSPDGSVSRLIEGKREIANED